MIRRPPIPTLTDTLFPYTTLFRSLAVLVLAFGLLALTPTASRRFRPLWWFGGASAGLVLLHLMPLPPAIWSAFPGREIVSGVFDASGLDKSWQPLSIDPFAGWNSLFSRSEERRVGKECVGTGRSGWSPGH